MKLITCFILLTLSTQIFASEKERKGNIISSIKKSIKTIAQSDWSCKSNNDCRVIGVGSKACGGYHFYVMGSKRNIFFYELLYLSKKLLEEERSYNSQYKIKSDCSLASRFRSECKENVCVKTPGPY